jgi:hypothetical protein
MSKELRTRYGKQTARIVADVQRGWTVQKIAAKRGFSITSVRTTVGNYTRGFYDNAL